MNVLQNITSEFKVFGKLSTGLSNFILSIDSEFKVFGKLSTGLLNASHPIFSKFKVFGNYEFTDDLNVGLILFVQEGRARNLLGYHPKNVDSCAEGNNITWCDDWDRQNFYVDGNPSPRGSGGHGGWGSGPCQPSRKRTPGSGPGLSGGCVSGSGQHQLREHTGGQ